PFHRPDFEGLHPLSLIQALDNPHKHRSLLAAEPGMTWVNFMALAGAEGVYESVSNGLEGPLQDGVVVARCKFVKRETGHKSPLMTQAKVIVTYELAFAKEGPGKGHAVIPVISSIAGFIEHIVFPFTEEPLEEGQKLDHSRIRPPALIVQMPILPALLGKR